MADRTNSSNKNQENIQNNTVEIDLKRLWKAVWSRIWMVGLSAILCATLAFLGTFYLIVPKYQSSALFYVNNNSLSLGEASFGISSADITARVL